MRTPPVIPGIFSKIEEFLYIKVPSLQIGADGTFALTSLIYRHRGIADDLQKWNHTLTLTIGPFDVGIGCSDIRPVISQTARPLRKPGIIGNYLENIL